MTDKRSYEGFNIILTYDEISETCIALEARAAMTTSATRNIVYSALYKFQQWRKQITDQKDEETKNWIQWKIVLYKPDTGSTLEEKMRSSKLPSDMDMNDFASFLCRKDYPGWVVMNTELI